MSRPPVFSVLMPNYNNRVFLPQSIESVLGQGFGDLELVISDNASTDDSLEIIERYARQDSRVKVVRNPVNIGLCGNFNRAYRESNPESEYFVFLPADDYWGPSVLEETVAIGQRHPEVTVIHTDGYKVDPQSRPLHTYMGMFRHLPPEGPHQAVRELYTNDYVMPVATVIRRSGYKRFYPYPLPYKDNFLFGVDYLMFLEMLTRGTTFFFNPNKIAFSRDNPSSLTSNTNLIPRAEEEVRVFEYLASVCPPELEPLRQEALRNRLATLAFLLIQAENVKEAKGVLQKTRQTPAPKRMDVAVADLLLSAPLPSRVKSWAWRTLVDVAQNLRR